MINLNKIATEQRNKESFDLDEKSPIEIVELINKSDEQITKSINKKIKEISKVVEIAGQTIKNGGRIIYMGAGTSGRLGVLDAVECPPTFGVDQNTVIGLIAGGEEAFIKAKEGAEDSKELAIEDLNMIKINKYDFIIGIAASGRTPYVIGGLEYANKLGCNTASIAITYNSEIAHIAKYPIEVEVGPEILTGSTRMKAGTAQKMILNMISTGAMVLNGFVYQNLMVDVLQTNKKLEQRAINIIIQATNCEPQIAKEKIKEAEGHAKTAIVMILKKCNSKEAKELLKESNGFIKDIK